MKLDTNTKTLTLAVGETVTLQCVAADAISPPPFTLPAPGSYTLTAAQQAAKTEALKTALPLAQTNPEQLRKLNNTFFDLFSSRVSDPVVVRNYQQTNAGVVYESFQLLVEAAPPEGRVDVLFGIWSACQEALKTVK